MQAWGANLTFLRSALTVRHFEAEGHGASNLRAGQHMKVFIQLWVYLKSREEQE